MDSGKDTIISKISNFFKSFFAAIKGFSFKRTKDSIVNYFKTMTIKQAIKIIAVIAAIWFAWYLREWIILALEFVGVLVFASGLFVILYCIYTSKKHKIALDTAAVWRGSLVCIAAIVWWLIVHAIGNAILPVEVYSPKTYKSSDQRAKAVLKMASKVDTPKDIDQIKTTLDVLGYSDMVVKRVSKKKIIAVSELTSKEPAIEAIVKFSSVISTASKFVEKGELTLLCIRDGDAIMAIQGDIAKAVEFEKGKISWPELMKTFKTVDKDKIQELIKK